jgi:hypothetical protein
MLSHIPRGEVYRLWLGTFLSIAFFGVAVTYFFQLAPSEIGDEAGDRGGGVARRISVCALLRRAVYGVPPPPPTNGSRRLQVRPPMVLNVGDVAIIGLLTVEPGTQGRDQQSEPQHARRLRHGAIDQWDSTTSMPLM